MQIWAPPTVRRNSAGGHQRNHHCLVSSVTRAGHFAWTLRSGMRRAENLHAGVAVVIDGELRSRTHLGGAPRPSLPQYGRLHNGWRGV